MNIDKAVRYLEYKKLRLKILLLCLNILPNKLYQKVELIFNKPIFQNNPRIFSYILLCLNTILITIGYIILVIFIPERITIFVLFLILLEVGLLTIYFSLHYLKTDFFDYFASDHFFNLLSENQGEFIIKRIRSVYDNLLYHFLIPFTIPVFIHLVFYKHLYLTIILMPLIVIFLYQFIRLFSVIYWYISVFLKKHIFLTRIIFSGIKYAFALFLCFLLMFIIGLLINPEIVEASTDNGIWFFVILIGVFLLFNGLLYLARNISYLIINGSYRKIIYFEGIKRDKSKKKDSTLTKIFKIGTINLNYKEIAIYEKDMKFLLRRNNGKTYIYVFSILITLMLIIIGIGSSFSNDINADFLGIFILLNVFIAQALGYFVLIHKYITSIAAEGTNHEIYNKVKINFLQVFKAKLALNRFTVYFPFILYFIILMFKIRSLENLGLYLILLFYYYGIVNLVIKATMIDDFFNPQFNGVGNKTYLENRSKFFSGIYPIYLVYAFVLFPLSINKFLEITNIWVIAVSILGIIYIINFFIYRKTRKLKQVKKISYGGVKYVKSQ